MKKECNWKLKSFHFTYFLCGKVLVTCVTDVIVHFEYRFFKFHLYYMPYMHGDYSQITNTFMVNDFPLQTTLGVSYPDWKVDVVVFLFPLHFLLTF